MKLFSVLRWLSPLLLVLSCSLGFNASAFAGGKIPQTQTWGGSCNNALSYGGSIYKSGSTPLTGLTKSRDAWACANSMGGILQTQDQIVCVDSAIPDFVNWVCKCPAGTTKIAGSPNDACVCPSGKVQNATTGLCEDPPPLGCQYPKEDDGAGGCKCPEGQIEEGETCKVKPDCSKKQTECSTACGGIAGVAYFYCENSTSSDPSTQLFSGATQRCDCAQKGDCAEGQIKILAADGTATCGNSKAPGCPTGSYYGEFNGLTGCIKTEPHPDPDETPNNCISGTNSVYFGSTLYCVPPPDSQEGCPTGTTPYLAGSLKICKGTDQQGNSTGDSPDTNGSIKGTPTSGSGVAQVQRVKQRTILAFSII